MHAEPRRSGIVLAGCLLAVAAVPLTQSATETTRPPGSQGRQPLDSVTFAEDVAPILYENCVTCHRPGGAAPFSLLGWSEARERASKIAEVTRERYMPPWLPEPGYVDLVGERRLEEREIEVLQRWAEAGAPRGDPSKTPPEPEFSGDWQLGEPDLRVTMSEPYTVPPDAEHDIYRNFVLDVPTDSIRWVEAVEILPGDPEVVHHAMLLVDPSPYSRIESRKDSAPGFQGMMAGRARPPTGFLPGWTPGRMPTPAPEGTAWKLEAGTDLVLQLHLRPADEPVEVRPDVGLHFADGPPERRPVRLKLTNGVLNIPPGDSSYVVRDSFEVPVDAEALSIFPHSHYLGDEMKCWAVLPDGRRKWLINIEDWDFNFQDFYRYEEPVRLPAGSRLVMEISYDNSADNPQNPNDPPKRVLTGLESDDEMAEMHVQLAAADPAKRSVLQLMIKARGRPHSLQEYADHFRRVVEMEPGNARGHYQLGAVLAEMGRPREAAEHLRRAMEMKSDWWLPPVRLARLLATASEAGVRNAAEAVRLAERGAELSERQLPRPLEVLATAYAAAGRWREAADVARRAEELAREQGRGAMADRLVQARQRYEKDARRGGT